MNKNDPRRFQKKYNDEDMHNTVTGSFVIGIIVGIILSIVYYHTNY